MFDFHGIFKPRAAPPNLGFCLLLSNRIGLILCVYSQYQSVHLQNISTHVIQTKSIGFWPTGWVLSCAFPLCHARSSGSFPPAKKLSVVLCVLPFCLTASDIPGNPFHKPNVFFFSTITARQGFVAKLVFKKSATQKNDVFHGTVPHRENDSQVFRWCVRIDLVSLLLFPNKNLC